MFIAGVAAVLVFIIASVHLRIVMKRRDEQDLLTALLFKSNKEFKQTLAMGLYYRFNYPRKENSDKVFVPAPGTNLFLKQTPLQFEAFVADILERYIGGRAYTTVSSGDTGVDIEHFREDGVYLGQVKAYKDDLSYEPIALVHSNIVKRKASGGFIITTSSYSKAAKKYAEGLGIELINGTQFADMWLKVLEEESTRNEKLIPETT